MVEGMELAASDAAVAAAALAKGGGDCGDGGGGGSGPGVKGGGVGGGDCVCCNGGGASAAASAAETGSGCGLAMGSCGDTPCASRESEGTDDAEAGEAGPSLSASVVNLGTSFPPWEASLSDAGSGEGTGEGLGSPPLSAVLSLSPSVGTDSSDKRRHVAATGIRGVSCGARIGAMLSLMRPKTTGQSRSF